MWVSFKVDFSCRAGCIKDVAMLAQEECEQEREGEFCVFALRKTFALGSGQGWQGFPN